jgi:hypothetical protein
MKNNNLNKVIFRIIVAMLLLSSIEGNAQSLTGTRGLIKAPTARMYESGTLAIGMGYVPAKFFKRTFNNRNTPEIITKGLRSGNSGLNTFITVNLTPFLEVMFRYTHELNLEVNPQTTYFPDRMFSARFKLLEEKKYLPTLLLGLDDVSEVFSVTEGDSNFSSSYIVASKYFKIRNLNFDASIGYGFNFKSYEIDYHKGVFGGVEISNQNYDKFQLIIDYDDTNFSMGLQSYVINRIHTVVGLMNFKPIFILAYRYKI